METIFYSLGGMTWQGFEPTTWQSLGEQCVTGPLNWFHCDYCHKCNTKIINREKYSHGASSIVQDLQSFLSSDSCFQSLPHCQNQMHVITPLILFFIFCVKTPEGLQQQLCGTFNFTFGFASRHLCCVALPNSSDLRRLETRASISCSVFAVAFGETKQNPETGCTH